MRAFGMDIRRPFSPEASKKAPMDAAKPRHTVLTGAWQNCIAVNCFIPVDAYPGELMKSLISFVGSC